jgi:AraC-like DNA-binding protein
MSVSGFHHHFKAVTAMSPLQFQKRMRLQAARRLMLGEDLDATSAVTEWATATPRSSAASTRGSSGRRRRGTRSGCGKPQR